VGTGGGLHVGTTSVMSYVPCWATCFSVQGVSSRLKRVLPELTLWLLSSCIAR
jgi:hypothetical protein